MTSVVGLLFATAFLFDARVVPFDCASPLGNAWPLEEEVPPHLSLIQHNARAATLRGRMTREIKKRVVIAVDILETISEGAVSAASVGDSVSTESAPMGTDGREPTVEGETLDVATIDDKPLREAGDAKALEQRRPVAPPPAPAPEEMPAEAGDAKGTERQWPTPPAPGRKEEELAQNKPRPLYLLETSEGKEVKARAEANIKEKSFAEAELLSNRGEAVPRGADSSNGGGVVDGDNPRTIPRGAQGMSPAGRLGPSITAAGSTDGANDGGAGKFAAAHASGAGGANSIKGAARGRRGAKRRIRVGADSNPVGRHFDPTGDPALTAIGAEMWSSIAVTMAYFLVSVSLATVQTWNQARQHSFCAVERVLESTMSAINFAPMLCAVFLAVTKRAETVAHGDPSLYDLPPYFVRVAAVVSATGFCVHAAFWFCGEVTMAFARPPPMGTRRRRSQRAAVGRAAGSAPTAAAASGETGLCGEPGRVWTLLSHASLGVMHVALNVVFIGIILMREPEALYRQRGSPRMSAGTVCTLILAIPYFFVYLVLHALRSGSANPHSSKSQAASTSAPSSLTLPSTPPSSAYSAPFSLVLSEVAKLAATALSLAPMLCVLFLGAQLVEEWADEQSHPKGYVEACMYMCTAAVLKQLVLAVVAPFLAGAELHVIGPEGELDFVTKNHRVFNIVGVVRWLVMMALYVGVEVVCSGLWSLHELLPITHLLRHLVGCYFLMYAIQWLVISLKEVVGSGFVNAMRVLRNAKNVVSFCPMIAVLFLESWARPRRITAANGKPGVPQCYAQDCMYLATLAFLVQLLIVLLSGIISSSPVGTTSHRSASQRRDVVAFVLLAMFHAATLVLCVSVSVVIGSLFTLTPDNAVEGDPWLA